MGFFNEVLILLALILLLPVGERDRGVGLLYQRVPDVLFIAQNILDTANLPEGGILLGRDTPRRDLLCDILHADAGEVAVKDLPPRPQ